MTNIKKSLTEEEKAKKINEYIKSLKTVEDAMEPFKEQKRDLKENFIENGWLTKEEISMAVKAYRLVKGDVDFEQLRDFYDQIKSRV